MRAATFSLLDEFSATNEPMSRAARNTRPKKLAPRQNIQIVREDQVDSLVDFDNTRGPIETGVEKAEESVSKFIPHLFVISLFDCLATVASTTSWHFFTVSQHHR